MAVRIHSASAPKAFHKHWVCCNQLGILELLTLIRLLSSLEVLPFRDVKRHLLKESTLECLELLSLRILDNIRFPSI